MKHTKVIFLIGLLAVIGGSLFFLRTKEQPIAKAVEKVPEQKESTLRLAAVGDILLHDIVYNDARIDVNHFDFHPMLKTMQPYIEEADFAFANQESVIGGIEIGLSTYPSFNSPVEAADAVKDAGFDVINLANNHSLDRGKQALVDSISYWDQLGLVRTGAYTSAEDQQTIRTISKNGITCAVLSYTYGLNGIAEVTPSYLVNVIDKEKMAQDVKRARELADAVIVSLHFGTEYETMPNSKQTELVQFLADQGVNVIFGHHPHVLQPAAIVTGAAGNQTFVAYSLGNFLAGQERKDTYFGGMIEITLKKEENGEITLEDPAFLPTMTYEKEQTNFQVLPLAQVTEEQLPEVKQKYESIVSHMKALLPELRIVKTK